MKTYNAYTKSGAEISYTDKKRWFWLLSSLFPLQALIGIYFHHITDNQLWLLLPFIIIYILAPLIDYILKEDMSNPPDEISLALDADRYYRALTYLAVPMHTLSLLVVAWWIGTQNLDWWAYLSLSILAGIVSGLGINTGHELGHKRTNLEKNLAKFVLAIPFYGHFTIDHNQGHHRDVATPEDASSSRMGENFYQFLYREIPSSVTRSFQIETQRLSRRNQNFFCLNNQILQSYAISIALQGSIVIIFGLEMLPFLLIHNAFAWLQLSSANYIEHYGLLRLKEKSGHYERCKPHHSWNSNHIFSNLVFFHLQRHSDHHTHPTRRYQSLKHYEDLPSLPNGYLGCYLIAYLPWLWFYIMDKRLLQLNHIKGDLTKINIHPQKKILLEDKYRHNEYQEAQEPF
jgi:alkane 1-monooxygenase